MSDPFEDLTYSLPPPSSGTRDPFSYLDDETKVVADPPADPFGDIARDQFGVRPDDPSFTYKVMQGVKDAFNQPTVKNLRGVFEKNIANPFQFAAGKLTESLGASAKVAGKAISYPFEKWAQVHEYSQRQVVGKMILNPTADIFGHSGIHQDLPDAPSISEFLDAAIPTKPAYSLQENPVGVSTLTNRPLPKLQTKVDQTDNAKRVAKFFAGAGLSMLDPANIFDMVALEGISTALQVPGVQAKMTQFTKNMVEALPTDVQKEFRAGRFALTDEMKNVFQDRLNSLQTTFLQGEKVLDSVTELTPAERLRLGQIRQGSISIGQREKVIRVREKALGQFIDVLSQRLLSANETAKGMGAPLMSDLTAETIQANLGQYLPTLYRAFEAPLEANKIPSTFLQTLWSLPEKQLEAISRLSPKAADLALENIQRASQMPYPEASGFKPMRVKQQRLMSTQQSKRAADLWEGWNQEQKVLRSQANSFKLDDMGFNDVRVALLNQAGIDLETLASLPTDTPGGWYSTYTQMQNLFGEKFSTETMMGYIDKAKKVIRERNQILGKVGDLEYKKRNAPFFAEAKYGVRDLAASKESVSDTAKRLSGILDRPVTIEEANNLKAQAQQYVRGVLPPEQLGELRNISFDFEQYQRALGVIHDPAVLGAKAIMDIETMAENAKLFNVIASNSEWTLPKGGRLVADYVEMPNTPRLGALSGRWVKSQIADELNTVIDFQRNSDAWGQKMLSAWKYGKVVLSPSTHFRNMLSNTILLDASGVSLKEQLGLYGEAFDAVLNRNGMYKRAIKSGALTGTYVDAELRAIQKKLLEAPDPGEDVLTRLFNVVGDGFHKAGTVYQTEEELSKMVKFLHGIKSGLADDVAAKEAQFWLFNYNDIPPIVRKLRSSPFGVPFVTFPYKALPVIAKSLIENPMKLFKYELIFRAIENGSTAVQGITPERAAFEKDLAKKGSPLFTRYLRMPTTDDKGNPHFLDLTYILPWGDVGDAGNYFGIPASGQVGGLARPVIELMMNKSFYTKKPIYGERFNTALDLGKLLDTNDGMEVAQSMMTHLIRSYAPTLFPGMPGTDIQGGFAYERIKRAFLNRPASRTQDQAQSITSAALDSLMGLKTRADDLKQTYAMTIRDYIGQADILKKEIKNLYANGQAGVIPPNQAQVKIEMKKQQIEILKQQINLLRDQAEKVGFR